MSERLERWWARWVGLRIPPEVEAPCYFLIREVYQQEMGIVLPEEGVFAPRRRWARLIQQGLRGAWERLEAPQDLAVALVRLPAGWHIGIVAADCPLKLLSTVAGAAVLQRLSVYLERRTVRGYYTYRPPPSGPGPGTGCPWTSTPKSESWAANRP